MLEQFRHDIDPDDLVHERGECERERARTGAHVECLLVTVRLDERLELLPDQLDLLPGMLGHPVCRCTEACPYLVDVCALRHRSPYAARAAARSRFRTAGRS